MLSKTCLLCDKPVEKSLYPDRKFCSTSHRYLYNTFTKEQKAVEVTYINCKYCNNLICKTAKSHKKVFCTDYCESRWWYFHPRERVCNLCQEVFTPKTRGQKCCSTDHANKHKTIRRWVIRQREY